MSFNHLCGWTLCLVCPGECRGEHWLCVPLSLGSRGAQSSGLIFPQCWSTAGMSCSGSSPQVCSPALLFGHSLGFSLGFLLLPKPGTGLLQEHGQRPKGVINQQLFLLMQLGVVGWEARWGEIPELLQGSSGSEGGPSPWWEGVGHLHCALLWPPKTP